MRVRKFSDSEYGYTIRTVWAGGHKFKSVVIWKCDEWHWIEIVNTSKLPLNVLQQARKIETNCATQPTNRRNKI